MTTRWVLTEVATSATWTMPLNPDQMSSPTQDREIATSYAVRWIARKGIGGVNGTGRISSFATASQAKEWTWGGVIRTKDHYDQLAAWARKDGKVQVTDHLGRTFEVLMTAFEPEDRQPTKSTPWRLRYTMRTLLLRRIS